jgi:hypothetical protein
MTTNEREWHFGGPHAVVGVLLEPLNGHTADEVAQLAREHGVADVAVLSSGVVSATGKRKDLDSLSDVATAHPKSTAQLR